MSLQELQDKLIAFAQQRDWEKFHTPKNLSMALSVEASELMEHFQWLTEGESHKLPADKHRQVSLELADVFMYTLLMARKLDIDLYQVSEEKIKINEAHYPKDLVKGSAKKYHEY